MRYYLAIVVEGDAEVVVVFPVSRCVRSLEWHCDVRHWSIGPRFISCYVMILILDYPMLINDARE